MISPGTYTVILDTASFCTNAQSVDVILSALRSKRTVANVDVFDAFGGAPRQADVELSRLLTIVHHDVCANALLRKHGPRSVVHLRDHLPRADAPFVWASPG